jgi:guanylate kinase
LEKALESSRPYLLEIDVQGARKIKEQSLYDTLFIFIKPPDVKVLQERLTTRHLDSPQVIEQRIKNALQELREADFYHHYVVNISLEKAISEVQKIIEKALQKKSEPLSGS